ncbi:MAG: hypothetical protein MZV64_72040 [Ignavibacteriales bacterium]|nr:hypothetical protein [Ignavibacteriales bacterium]
MKVILRQDFETLGKIGEVVDVKDGYCQKFSLSKRYLLMLHLKAI